MTRTLFTLVAPAVLCLPLAAQSVVPPQLNGVEGSGQSLLPLGSNTSVRTQIIYGGTMLPATSIGSLTLRGNGGVVHPGITGVDLEIGLSNTTVSPWSMNSLFAANRGADYQSAFSRKIVNLPSLSSAPIPASFNIRFPMDVPRPIDPDPAVNLLVEWIVHDGGVGGSNPLYTVDAPGGDQPTHTHTGSSCGLSQLVTSAQVTWPSTNLGYSVSGWDYRNGTAVHLLGFNTLPVPAPLPFSTCLLYQDVLFSTAWALDAGGTAWPTYPLPAWSKGLAIHSQFLAIDAALTNLGASKSTRTVIGGLDEIGNCYSRAFWHTSGVVGLGGAVMQIN